jgi:serine/threonine-protein kinase
MIYRAHDPDIDRRVAVKLIRADLLDGGDRTKYLDRFRAEAQAAARCNHPNIVSVYDFALHDGNPYLAMEFVDGTTLGRRSRRAAAPPPADAAAVMLQTLAALQAAHAMGVIHRDIKPANIMLTPQGQVQVADFGISRLGKPRAGDTATVTTTGVKV